MKIVKPSYYDTFRCLAAECPDSCCKEWDVLVDDRSADLYRSLPGDLGDRLRQVLSEDEDGNAVMTIENRRCPMWRADGLCRIQAELGHDALCATCRDFPRLKHDYGDFVQLDLELSCPEAARLMLTQPHGENIVTERSGGDTPDYDPEDMALLLQTRNTVCALLKDHSRPLPQTLALALMYAYHAQSLLDGADGAFDPDAALAEAREFARPGNADALAEFFSGLEILSERWPQRLSTPAPLPDWPEELRNLALCGIQRYWLQAISDYDIVSRAKMVIVSCLLVHHLGGDVVATAQLYAKEIENNADNVEAVLDAAYTHPAFTDDKLLGLLLL